MGYRNSPAEVVAASRPSAGAGWSAALVTNLRGALNLVFSGIVLLLLATIIDWPELGHIVASARWEFLLLAAALLVVGNTLIAWRWKLLLDPVGVQTTVAQALRSYLKGHFIAHFVPSGLTADVVKGFDMHGARAPHERKVGMEVASSIFIERGFGALTVGFAVLLGLAISPLVGRNAGLGESITVAAMIVIFCCGLALYSDKFLGLLPERLLKRMPRVHALVKRAHQSFVTYRKTPLRLLVVMIMSIVIQSLRIVPVFCIGLALGAEVGFFAYLVAVPIIFLSAMVPIVGSRVGTEQGLFVLLLGLAGIRPETAMAIALVSLALSILVSLPGGVWLLQRRAPNGRTRS